MGIEPTNKSFADSGLNHSAITPWGRGCGNRTHLVCRVTAVLSQRTNPPWGLKLKGAQSET